MTDLSGATAVVTGAATGVGRALALEAGARGADIAAIDVDDPSDTAAMVAAAGGRARGWRCDVRDQVAMRSLADEVTGGDGTVNLLCANAGIGRGGTVDTVTSEDMADVFGVNVLGTIHTVQAFLPALRRARAADGMAAILVTGSEHSLGVPPHVPPMIAYTTSKHALLGLVACLRRDLAADGIGVSLLCPGYVRTERLQGYAAREPAMAEVLDHYGQDGEVVARCALDGVTQGAFVIPTNPTSRDFVVELHREVLESMERVSSC